MTEFDQMARQAVHEIRSGRRFQFRVKPDDTIVKVQQRGEKGIVQGRAREFDPKKDDARIVELPSDGDFLIHLIHDGFPEVRILAHVDAAVATGPRLIRLSMAEASRRQAGDPRLLRVARSVSFAGQPPGAEVWLDGRKVGVASDWPGAARPRSRKNLQLDPGRHTLRLVAPGFQPFELSLEVVASAQRKTARIEYSLKSAR